MTFAIVLTETIYRFIATLLVLSVGLVTFVIGHAAWNKIYQKYTEGKNKAAAV